MGSPTAHYAAICGGVGGAKLALGLAQLLGSKLTIIVNTGDDFEHAGLHVSPDLDTVMYTLSGLVNPETGWGRADESWSFMASLGELGGPGWFKLGDKDLAMHVLRTEWLGAGGRLSDFCGRIRDRLGLAPVILPMSDDPVRTMLETEDGELAFQDYFVARKCEPVVREIRFDGAETAQSLPAALDMLDDPQLAGIIICPSNPYLSIDPILSIPAMREALHDGVAPVVAVSPLIGGKAVKGPTAKLMRELGVEVSSRAIAEHYNGFLDGFIVDRADAEDACAFPVPVRYEETLMTDLSSKISLARAAIDFCEMLRGEVEGESTSGAID